MVFWNLYFLKYLSFEFSNSIHQCSTLAKTQADFTNCKHFYTRLLTKSYQLPPSNNPPSSWNKTSSRRTPSSTTSATRNPLSNKKCCNHSKALLNTFSKPSLPITNKKIQSDLVLKIHDRGFVGLTKCGIGMSSFWFVYRKRCFRIW